MKTHELKILKPFFESVESGEKTFEIRKNDRGFQKGDRVILQEVIGVDRFHTGRTITKKITFVLGGWGLQEDYVALGLGEI